MFEGDKIFVYVFERRRRGNRFENTEAESMGLVGLMIGILSDDDNFDVFDGGCFEGIEDIFHFGVDLYHDIFTFFPDSYSALTYR